jgi:hypothetical protein
MITGICCFVGSVIGNRLLPNQQNKYRGATSTDKQLSPDTPVFLNHEIASQVSNSYGTPLYVYDERTLVEHAKSALNFPNAFGLTVRFAMKACPNAAILKVSMSNN